MVREVSLVGIAALGALAVYLSLDHYQTIDRLELALNAARTEALTSEFPYCGEGRHVTCIVGGDTFWLDGEKIRVADIDAPELSPPRCEAERIKGEAAKRRLQVLLEAGPFSLVIHGRPQDRYGRRLRMVMRAGRSVGAILVQEELAHSWGGPRGTWCE